MEDLQSYKYKQDKAFLLSKAEDTLNWFEMQLKSDATTQKTLCICEYSW